MRFLRTSLNVSKNRKTLRNNHLYRRSLRCRAVENEVYCLMTTAYKLSYYVFMILVINTNTGTKNSYLGLRY